MKKRKYIICFITGLFTATGILSGSLIANAATIDEVAEVARKYGISESYIQAGYNNYYQNPDKYTSEDFDNAIACLELYGEDSEQAIMDYFGVTSIAKTTTTALQSSANKTTSIITSTTTVASSSSNTNGNSSNNSSSSNNTSGNSSNNSSSSNNTSGNGSNNSSGNLDDDLRPISVAEFIKMTLEEKKEFINTLSDDEKAVFLGSLTNEERNSIIKALPTDTKIDILSNFIDAGNSMGLNMQIEDLENDKLSMSIRDDEGKLIDVSNVGVTVADTGYDYKLFALIGGAVILASLLGFYLIFKKLSAEENAEENNVIK